MPKVPRVFEMLLKVGLACFVVGLVALIVYPVALRHWAPEAIRGGGCYPVQYLTTWAKVGAVLCDVIYWAGMGFMFIPVLAVIVWGIVTGIRRGARRSNAG